MLLYVRHAFVMYLPLHCRPLSSAN